MSNRAERREEIKLVLDQLRTVLSLFVVASIIFAGLQWRTANHAAQIANDAAIEAIYQRMVAEWEDNLKTFVEKPDLRPYFESGKSLTSDDPNRQAVLALADVRLDVMDAILTYAALHGFAGEGEIGGWKNTFDHSFRTSPVLCMRLNESASDYGLIVPIGRAACRHADR
jgi:hypothetical protein